MIDLHVHFPMRLLGGVEAPRDVLKGMTRVRGRDDGKLRAAVLAIAARLFNFRHWDATWRVTPELLEQGQVSVACSVLYRPFSELDLDEPYGAPPESAYYAKLVELMDATEAEIARTGGILVRRAEDLDHTGLRYVHCIEGGFHLGATEQEVTAHVRELAERGVLYITLAHLFWRRVAANTPALPFLPDAVYNALFPQAKGVALSPLGEAAVRAMYAAGILVDISHMRDDAIDETFALIEALDRETGADPRDYPVIVSHAGYRFGAQKYNVSDATIKRVAARGGVIGLIFAQHQINDGLRRADTKTLAESLDVLGRHIDAIGAGHVAIGSDLDGFIKPTLGGIDSAADLAPFAAGLRARYPDVAEQILEGNARRVIQRRFASAAP
jgi:microsomal dipeptidase-like Zn-dependent dipeptidase